MKKLISITLMFLVGCISKPLKMNEMDYYEYEWRNIQQCELDKKENKWSSLNDLRSCRLAEVAINRIECKKNWKLECLFVSERVK